MYTKTKNFLENLLGDDALKELKDFISYLKSFFGIFSGISVFFPLAERTFEIILPPKEYADQAILLATLSCALALIYHFSHRKERKKTHELNKKKIYIPVVLATVYIVVIKDLPVLAMSMFSFRLIWELILGSLIISLIAIIKVLTYVLIFFLLTDTSATFAVREWQSKRYKDKS